MCCQALQFLALMGRAHVQVTAGVSTAALKDRYAAAPLSSQFLVADGGGLGSTVEWLRPQKGFDKMLPLRKCYERLVVEWGLVGRLRDHVRPPSSNSILTAAEEEQVRAELISFLQKQGFDCDAAIREHQPFLLSAWRALGQLMPHCLTCKKGCRQAF